MNTTSRESVCKMDERIDKLADQLSTLVEIVSKKVITPAPVKAVEEICVTCGGAHSWYNCPATDNNQASVCATTGTYNQVNPPNRVSNQMASPASTSGTLPSNTIPNPKGEMKAITTRSGVAYEGPSIPTNPSPKKVVERETEETTDKEQTNFQGSTAQIPPPVIPISILEPDVPKTLPKTTPILESDVPKSLPKPNIPYPSRRDDQKSRDKASNQMEKIFQIFQDLRFDISFADALLLMPRFAPTIKSLLMNKEKLLELAKIPLNENCSAMLLKKLPEKLGDPGKFLIPCNFLGMDKKLSLPELTPTRMTLELADRSITHPKGLAKDVFVKVKKFHFPTDFVVVDFEADPRVPLILGRSFLRTRRTLIDVYEGELMLRDGDERLIFHVNKHSQKHANESIKMINFSCEDILHLMRLAIYFLRSSPMNSFFDPFPPGNEDFDVETNLRQIELLLNRDPSTKFSLTFTIDSNPKKFTDELAPACLHLPRDDESFLKEDVQEENFQVYSNPLFEFDDNYNSSDINPLFKEMLEDVESKDSNISNFDKPVLLNTPLFDKAECFDPGGEIDEIDAFLAIELPTYIKEGYYESKGDVFYLESLLSDDTTHNLFPEVFFDHEPQHFKNESDHDTLITFSPKSDPLHHEFTDELITLPPRFVREHEEYISRMWMLCGNSSSRSPENFHASPNTIIESLPTIPIKDSDSLREEIDIFHGPDDSIPAGIDSDFDSEDDTIFLDNLRNGDISFLEYERFTFDIESDAPVINNFDELNEDECFDPGGGEINVEVDDSFTIFIRTFLPYLTFPKVSPLLSSTENED
ncbi:reverse transcriptase domain-containing protein, partial [Tanacetum coccineum]